MVITKIGVIASVQRNGLFIHTLRLAKHEALYPAQQRAQRSILYMCERPIRSRNKAVHETRHFKHIKRFLFGDIAFPYVYFLYSLCFSVFLDALSCFFVIVNLPASMVFTARCYASAVLAMALCPSVCLSVCLSQVGVLLKLLNVGSHKQHHTIDQEL